MYCNSGEAPLAAAGSVEWRRAMAMYVARPRQLAAHSPAEHVRNLAVSRGCGWLLGPVTVQPQAHKSVSLCAARALHAIGEPRVCLSLR